MLIRQVEVGAEVISAKESIRVANPTCLDLDLARAASIAWTRRMIEDALLTHHAPTRCYQDLHRPIKVAIAARAHTRDAKQRNVLPALSEAEGTEADMAQTDIIETISYEHLHGPDLMSLSAMVLHVHRYQHPYSESVV